MSPSPCVSLVEGGTETGVPGSELALTCGSHVDNRLNQSPSDRRVAAVHAQHGEPPISDLAS